MHLKILVFSFIFFFSLPVYSQVTCEFINKEGGEKTKIIECDGNQYIYFKPEEAKKLLKVVSDQKSKEKELSLQKQKNKICQARVKEKQKHINFLYNTQKSDREIFAKQLDNPSKKFYNSNAFYYFLGVGTSSLMYGFWAYTDHKRNP